MKAKIDNQILTKDILDKYFTSSFKQLESKISLILKAQVDYINYYNKNNNTFYNNLSQLEDIFNKSNIPIKDQINTIKNSFIQFQQEIELYNKKVLKLKDLFINLKTKTPYALKLKKESSKLFEVYKTNQSIIQQLIELNKNNYQISFNSELYQILLMKNNLDSLFRIINTPKKFIDNYNTIQNEIIYKKKFEMIYEYFLIYLQGELFEYEKKRRQKFVEKVDISLIKKDLYSELTLFFVQNNTSKAINNKIDNNFVQLLNNFKEQGKYILSNINKDYYSNNDQQLISIIQNKNSNIIDNKAGIKNSTENDLKTIKNELQKVLINNFNVQNFKSNNVTESILEMIQILNDKTKVYTNDIIDLSNSSIITSINFNNESFRDISNKSLSNLNGQAIVIEKVIEKYQDKLYLFDTLFDYVQNFLVTVQYNSLLSKMKKDNPKSLAEVIESLFKEFYIIKSKYYKLINKIQLLKKHS